MIPLLVQPISNEESTNILPVPWIRFLRCRFHGIDRLVDNLNALENLCREHGVQAEAYLDLQHLPVFGSDKPGLLDVWSWDDECVLKHDGCRADGGWYTEFRDVQVA